MEIEKVTLDNLGKGAARELFERELESVIANVLDPNTNPKTKRAVILKVTFEPEEDNRGAAKVLISCTAKLAPTKVYGTRVYMAIGGEGAVAREDNPAKQGTLFQDQVKDEAKAKLGVLPAPGVEKGGGGA